MAVTLTPEQQAALDKFLEDATAAADAKTGSEEAAAALITAQGKADRSKQEAFETHVQALEDATAFINLMVPPAQQQARKAALKKPPYV